MGTGKGGRRFDYISLEKCVTSALKCSSWLPSTHKHTHTHTPVWSEQQSGRQRVKKKPHRECTTAHCDRAMSEPAPLVIIFSVLQPPRCFQLSEMLCNYLPTVLVAWQFILITASSACQGWWGGIYCTTLQECCRWGMFGHDKANVSPLLFSPPPPTTCS